MHLLVGSILTWTDKISIKYFKLFNIFICNSLTPSLSFFEELNFLNGGF